MNLIPRHLLQYFPDGKLPNEPNLVRMIEAVPGEFQPELRRLAYHCFTRYMSYPIGSCFRAIWQEHENKDAVKRARLLFILAEDTEYKGQKGLAHVRQELEDYLAREPDHPRRYLLLALFRYDYVPLERKTKAHVIHFYLEALLSSDPVAYVKSVPAEIAAMADLMKFGQNKEKLAAFLQWQKRAEITFIELGLPSYADVIRKRMEQRVIKDVDHNKLAGSGR